MLVSGEKHTGHRAKVHMAAFLRGWGSAAEGGLSPRKLSLSKALLRPSTPPKSIGQQRLDVLAGMLRTLFELNGRR